MKKKEVTIEPQETLLDVLRRLGYLSVRRGCTTTSCSACTVLVDDKPVHSCSYLAARAEGRKVVTIEGIEEKAKEITKFFTEAGAIHCGFCTPGFIMTLVGLEKELENESKEPTDEEILNYFTGNLCRCTGYVAQLTAIKDN